MNEIILKVAEAEHRDIGRFIVRLDAVSMEKLSVRTGDIVQIKGEKGTAAIAWPAYQVDKGREPSKSHDHFFHLKNIIGIIFLHRQNYLLNQLLTIPGTPVTPWGKNIVTKSKMMP